MALIELESINLNLEGNSKEEVLRELSKVAYKINKVTSEEGFFNSLMNREEEATTGFGFGIAVPHAKSSFAKEVGIIVGRKNDKIDWDALDGNPVSTFICLIAPKNGADEHLKLLSKISRKLMHNDFIEVLKNGNEVEILSAIKDGIIS